jgi:uncharacterized membrane protein YfcA
MAARTLVGTRGAAGTSRLRVKRIPTVCAGLVGGAVVGMTSVGSGSLMIVFLTFLYPSLTVSRLVGTDLAQSVPLVASAAVGQLLFGAFSAPLTLSLLIGGIPAVYAGARLSSRVDATGIRPFLQLVLLLSGLKLLQVPNQWILVVATALVVATVASNRASRSLRFPTVKLPRRAPH